LRIEVSIQQSLAAAMRHEVDTLDEVTAKVVRAVGGRAKVLLRRDTSAALGQRVANAWRDTFYPNAERGPARAADLVFTKAPKIIDAFDVGATIKPRAGRLLAIPTEYVRRDRDGHKMNPASFAEAGIELRFIPPGRFGRYAALVADNFRVTGAGRPRYGQVGRRGRVLAGAATLVMYWLIPRAKLPKRLDLETHRQATRADLFNSMVVGLRNAP
jgi:hypothetical protein